MQELFKMIVFLFSIFFGNSLLHAIPIQNSKQSPNVIVVMTDDQGYGDFGFLGNDTLRTPNLDELAKQSSQLTRFYVHPVCTPTRAALMTGRYPQRTGAYDTYVGRAMMFPKETTIAELLKNRGYATGIFGKWHLGDCYPMRPTDQGFDESLIHLGGGLAQPSDPIENNRRYTNPILFHNNKQKQLRGYCTDIFFSNAMDFIKRSKKAGKPFFTYIATNAPHGPFHDVPKKSLEKYLGKTVDEKTARIFAMIDNVDHNMGELMNFLKKEDLEKNTILIFLTDNGPNTARFVGPFRGKKGQTLEGGIRTTFLARWPDVFPAGHKNETPTANIDIAPTIAAATGTEISSDLKIDGISVLSLLKGTTPKSFPVNRPLVFQWHRGEPARGRSFALVSGNWKLTASKPNQRRRLYDVQNDPGESKDLSAQQPQIKIQMEKEYELWYDSLADGKPYQYLPNPILIGTEKEKETRFTKQDWYRSKGNGWGTLGFWHFKSLHSRKYSATIVLNKPLKKEMTIEINAAGTVFSYVLPAGRRKCVFQEIEIPVCEGKLQVSGTGNLPIPQFYQLILNQQD